MKSVAVLLLFALVGLVLSETAVQQRGCIYYNGRCQTDCEEGTRLYTTGCGYLTPEATCNEPNPVEDTRGRICDYMACYCEPPTVRDTITNKCVAIEDCSNEEVCDS